jgi:hypothetical protein
MYCGARRRSLYPAGIGKVPLTDFDVDLHQRDITGEVIVVANDGKKRVLAFIPREALEDYGEKYLCWPVMTFRERLFLVRSDRNREAVGAVIAAKYTRGEVSAYNAYGQTYPRVDVDLDDLEAGPRLEVTPLLVLNGAGFQR